MARPETQRPNIKRFPEAEMPISPVGSIPSSNGVVTTGGVHGERAKKYPPVQLEVMEDGHLILDGIELPDLNPIEHAILTLVAKNTNNGITTSLGDFRELCQSHKPNMKQPDLYVRSIRNNLNDKLQSVNYAVSNINLKGEKHGYILRNLTPQDEMSTNSGVYDIYSGW